MSEDIVALIQKIECDVNNRRLQLPSLPDVAVQINTAINDSRKGVADVARLVQADPGLAARLIRIANSPLYRTATEVTGIRQAITRLGLGVTRNFVISLIMHNIFTVRSLHLQAQIRDLWQHSCRVAAISQVLAGLSPGLRPDQALLAGLLHDIGVLPVLVYADQFPVIARQPERLADVIHSLRGSLGVQIMSDWHFDTDLLEVPAAVEDWTRDHDGEADYADLVQVAHIHACFGTPLAHTQPALVSLPAFNKLSISKMGPHAGIELLEQARQEINATLRMLNGSA